MLLAGWALLALLGGGIDLGTLSARRGPLVLAVAAVVLPAAAVAALALRPTPWTLDSRLAVAGCAGFALWSALSIRWAIAPDLAWLSTNRALLACAALLAGLALGRAVTDAPRRFAVGLALAAGVVLAVALAMRIVPDLAPAADTVRLAAPIGYANALALVAVFAIPGAAAMLGRAGRERGAGIVIVAMSLTAVAMAQSRSGLLALLVTLVGTFWWLRGRAWLLAALAGGLAVVPALAYAAAAPGLTGATLLPSIAERRLPSLVFGALLLTGIVAAVLVTPSLVPAIRTLDRRWGRRGRQAGLGLVGLAVLGGAAIMAFSRSFAGVAGIGRLASSDSNNRGRWWEEAWHGFLDSPLIGHGAGSFPLTHLQERGAAIDQLQTRQPHQLLLEALTETGIVGAALAAVAIVGVVLAARRLGRTGGPAATIVGAFLVQAQFDWTWTIPATSLPALAAAGVLVGAPTTGVPRPRTGSRTALWLLPVAFAAAVSALWSWWGSDQALRAEQLRLKGDSLGALRLALDASRSAPLAIHGNLIAARIYWDANKTPAAAREAAEATRRQPDNPIAWECMLLTGNGPQQRLAATRIAALNPTSAQALHNPSCSGSW